jgi:hypothetical protein
MRNHFHLVVKTPMGNLSEFMRHFNISYTTAYNHRHNRSGHLYGGRYKAFLIDADNYLLAVSRYIHLNPVRTKTAMKKSLDERWRGLMDYRWSSLQSYFSERRRIEFVNCSDVLSYTGGDNAKGRGEYRKFVQAGLREGLANPLELGKGHGVVGGEEFIKWVKHAVCKDDEAKREQPALRELGRLLKPEELVGEYIRMVGKKREDICCKRKQLVERAILMELLYRLSQIPQPEIGRLLGGIDYSAVSRSRRKLREAMARDAKLKSRFEKIFVSLLEKSRVKI